MLTAGEVALILEVDRNLIKQWAYMFREYLSSKANPFEGEVRYFTQKDLMILALISWHWEDDPDYENICVHINNEDYYSERFVEFAYLNTPVFQDISDDFEDGNFPAWQLYGGWKEDNLSMRIANAYEMAGDQLVTTAIDSDTAYELFYPIVFTYRHALEVYLKILLSPAKYDKTHEFSVLIQACQDRYGKKISKWAKDRLLEFEEVDRKSDAFRYADSKTPHPSGEMIIDLRHLRVVVNHLCTGLRNLALSQ